MVLDPNGIPISTYVGTKTCPAVASASNLCLVTWQNQCGPFVEPSTEIHATRVATDGIVLDTNGLLVTRSASPNSQVAASGNSVAFLVVWTDRRVPTNYSDLYGARISPDGSVLDPDGIPISTAPFWQSSPCVAAVQRGFLVGWADERLSGDSDIYGARVDNAGQVVGQEIA